ncbi:hypothetical protein OG735_03900 [Streptomyces sp. NBC_01210]|uniref:hypothetical protein n=1 Tax=Streptomyces sp. NBC_01210 TaxID=2903774 RepID=UPI002E113753|nr:hypothetical protein OG735_03900 [Streptomyces sp. NBC_01210]
MDSGQPRRPGIALLPAVCAVLLGLFLMHGAPATTTAGCHGAMSAPVPMHKDHAVASMTSAATTAMAHPGAAQASDASVTHGALCASTPARDRTPLPMTGLVTVIALAAAWSLTGRPAALGRTGRRGPPTGGRSLLLQVCIARA